MDAPTSYRFPVVSAFTAGLLTRLTITTPSASAERSQLIRAVLLLGLIVGFVTDAGGVPLAGLPMKIFDGTESR